MKQKTNISIKNNLGYHVTASMEVGKNNGYASGDILDANATVQLVNDKMKKLVGGAKDSMDTLKELSEAIPTKMSDLINDVGYITENNGSLQVNTTNISIISNQPFPESWPTTVQYSFSDLIQAIDDDENAVKGKVYLSTVHYSDLPGNLSDAELKVEIMDSNYVNKIAVFTITSANQAPYNWHTTMWNGSIEDWHSYALYTAPEEEQEPVE